MTSSTKTRRVFTSDPIAHTQAAATGGIATDAAGSAPRTKSNRKMWKSIQGVSPCDPTRNSSSSTQAMTNRGALNKRRKNQEIISPQRTNPPKRRRKIDLGRKIRTVLLLLPKLEWFLLFKMSREMKLLAFQKYLDIGKIADSSRLSANRIVRLLEPCIP